MVGAGPHYGWANMKLNHRIEFIDEAIDTAWPMVCVQRPKYSEVLLTLKSECNIAFAEVKLFTRDRYIDKQESFDSACALGEEVARRWNTAATHEDENEKLRALLSKVADAAGDRMPGELKDAVQAYLDVQSNKPTGDQQA